MPVIATMRPVILKESLLSGLTMTEKSKNEEFGFDPGDEATGESSVQTSGENAAAGDSDRSEDSQQTKKKRRRRKRSRTGTESSRPPRSNRGGGSGGGGGGGAPNRARGGGQQRNRRSAKFPANGSKEVVVVEGTHEGVLELHPKGYGFLRNSSNDYGALESDPFVSSSLVEKYRLREGVMLRGEVGAGVRGQGPRLHEIESIDGRPPEEFEQIKQFDDLTPINPFEQIRLETGPKPITMRVMDLLTPIGKGQRALIVAPPRSGKTMLLQDIANSISHNHPDIHLIVLLIDERPEEVTEMRRMVNGEVIASSMDRDVESHVRISQLIIERGKRIAESGKDCVILLDSITRTARAFNKWVGNSGRTGTGGLDVRALDIPRKMFGTAQVR